MAKTDIDVWVVNADTSFTLGELMTDYLRHLNDHLQQIQNNMDSSGLAP